MKETAVQFGKRVKLSGVFTEPATPTDMPIFIIFNSGVRHHAGCCRMSVKLARRFAELGVASFRFDLSGVGDSPTRGDAKSYLESSAEESVHAMDYLERSHGNSRFVLYGLCSGAHLGFRLAQFDKRVVGLVQVDGYVFKTPRFWYYYYLQRLLSLAKWKHLFTEKLPAKFGFKKIPPHELGLDDNGVETLKFPEIPPQDEVEQSYRKILDNSVEMLSYITESQHLTYNYTNQFFDMFPDLDFGDTHELIFMRNASHILIEQISQERVIRETTGWFLKKFAS